MSTPGAPLRFRMCGAFTVEVDGVALTDQALGSRKGRQLLAMLVAERGHLVPSERLVDALWPEEAPRDPGAGVATLVSRLRSRLGPDVVSGGRAAYGVLADTGCTVDVDEARAFVDDATARLASGEPALALSTVRAALELLTGEAVADLPDAQDWAADLRAETASLRRAALHVAAVAALAAADAETSSKYARDAVSADPFDEQARRDLMRALASDGRSAAALEVYADLARTLRQELGTDPHGETRDLHLAVLRGAPVRSGGVTSLRPIAATIVGRTAETAVVADLWSAAVGSRPGLALVTGEPGIGKSLLLDAAVTLAESTGGLALTARCHAAERSLFLEPVAAALRPHLAAMTAPSLRLVAGPFADTVAALLPDLAPILAVPPQDLPARGRPAIHVETMRKRTYEGVAHVLRQLSVDRPVLLVLDDVQDAGYATLDLLDYLPRHLGAARVLVMSASRLGAEATTGLAGTATVVALDLLPASAVAAMAATAGHADKAEELARRTRGHPFTIVELLAALSSGDEGTPRSLADTLLGRVARAGADQEQTVQAAAVLGRQVDATQLALLLDRPELEVVQRCEQLVVARLFARTGAGYEFANDLVQEVVYDALPVPVRRAYHRRAADHLRGLRPEHLARHAEVVEDWARAARAWLLAGEAATETVSAVDAVDLLRRAHAAARRAGADDLVVRCLLALAWADEALGEFDRAIERLDEALVLARRSGDRRLEMAALRRRGGDAPVALRRPVDEWAPYVETGLRISRELGDRAAEADLGTRLAVVSAGRLHFDQALDYARQSLTAARAAGTERALVDGLDALKTVHAYLGDADVLQTVLDELLPLLRRVGERWIAQWAVFESAVVPAARGDLAAAHDRVAEALELNRNSPWQSYEPFFSAYKGFYARLDGDLDTAIATGRRAVAHSASSGHPWWHGATCGLLAAALLAAGESEEAAAVADRGYSTVVGHSVESWVLLSLAPLAAASGDPELVARAVELLDAARVPPDHAWLLGADAYLCTARALRAIGRDDEAERILVRLRQATSPTHWPQLHALAGSDG